MQRLVALLLLAFAPVAHAADLDSFVTRIVAAYGGERAWRGVAVSEHGTIASMMGGHGQMKRTFRPDRRLRVDVVYPDHHEIRVLEGERGTLNGSAVTGSQLDAMRLQWARLEFPLVLFDHRTELRDLGMKEGLRLIEVALAPALTVIAAVDPKTLHIVRSAGKGTGGGQTIEFVTEYRDFRDVHGLLIAFEEESFAQGMQTGVTLIESVDVAGNPL